MKPIICNECEGSGITDLGYYNVGCPPCTKCGGHGKIWPSGRHVYERVKCQSCQGSGRVTVDCSFCSGVGATKRATPDDEMHLREQALAKLTKEERKVLGL